MSISTTSPPSRPTPQAKVPAEVWRLAGVVILGSFMTTLGSSLVNVGLNTISRDFKAPLPDVQWVTSAYLIAFAASLPLNAWLSRRLGVGRLWLGALVAFTAASALCAPAPNLPVLVGLRALQGLSGALLVPTGQTLIGQAAGPERMGRVLNATKIVVVLAPVIGPTIGGLLISNLSWRWLFLVNVPVGLLALVLGLLLVPRGKPTAGRPFDLGGFALIAGGLPLIIYGVTVIGRHHGVISPQVLATLPLGIVALVLFIWRSLTVATPVLDLRLFANRIYTAATSSVFLTGAALLGTMILFPLYFQLIRHQSVIHTGLLMLGIGGGTALSMPFGGPATDRIGGGIVTLFGLTTSLVGVLPLVFLDAHASFVVIEALQAVTGFGLGLSTMPALSVAYATVPRDRLPDATSEANIIQRLGGSVGSVMLVLILEKDGAATIGAFHTACLCLAGAIFLAVVLATWLTIEERRRRRHQQAPQRHRHRADRPRSASLRGCMAPTGRHRR